jgi:hypothetical protein
LTSVIGGYSSSLVRKFVVAVLAGATDLLECSLTPAASLALTAANNLGARSGEHLLRRGEVIGLAPDLRQRTGLARFGTGPLREPLLLIDRSIDYGLRGLLERRPVRAVAAHVVAHRLEGVAQIFVVLVARLLRLGFAFVRMRGDGSAAGDQGGNEYGQKDSQRGLTWHVCFLQECDAGNI